MAVTAEYKFSTATTEPPTGDQLRLNAADPMQATKAWMPYTTSESLDAYYLLLTQPAGVIFYLQDKNNHLQSIKFALAAAPVDRDTYAEWPLTPLSTSGTALQNAQVILLVVTDDMVATPPTGVTLVTLEDAKAELRVTHTEEDALITRKLEESQELVFRLLNFDGGSPFAPETAWTPETVPPDFRALLMQAFVDLYRWRGDDEEPPKDANQGGDGWPTARLMGMLRRWMEPVSA